MQLDAIVVLGVACVAWTTVEAVRLIAASRRRIVARTATARAPRRGLAAWDERGRPVRVEDVGPS